MINICKRFLEGFKWFIDFGKRLLEGFALVSDSSSDSNDSVSLENDSLSEFVPFVNVSSADLLTFVSDALTDLHDTWLLERSKWFTYLCKWLLECLTYVWKYFLEWFTYTFWMSCLYLRRCDMPSVLRRIRASVFLLYYIYIYISQYLFLSIYVQCGCWIDHNFTHSGVFLWSGV